MSGTSYSNERDIEKCPGSGNTLSDTPVFQYAGFGPRLGAFIFDNFIILMINISIIIAEIILAVIFGGDKVLGSSEGRTIFTWIYLLVVLLVNFTYFIYNERSKNQATPGKRAMTIMVVNQDGKRISFGQAIVRNLIKIPICSSGTCISLFLIGIVITSRIALLTITALLVLVILVAGLYLILTKLNKNRQGFHDIIAGTYVVKKEAPANVDATPSTTT